ncbi:MAG TPA: nucleotidyltransferase family protein [Candidatus Saccharimonadales bacterium]|nr:nucleotidyltransferase family protein [Candidatus Saccharimonadales bacterium]
MLAAVILSAGASSRMGRPKALLPYREGTFLEHLIQVTRDPRIGVTRVVLGSGAETIQSVAKLDPSVVVLNPNWELGQLSSIWTGIRSLEGIDTDGIVLCPVDHPLVSARLVSELVDRFYDEKKAIVLPTYKGKRGHPAIFSSQLFSEMLAAPAELGARTVVWAHSADVLEVPTDEEGVILNLNDPDMLKRVTGSSA